MRRHIPVQCREVSPFLISIFLLLPANTPLENLAVSPSTTELVWGRPLWKGAFPNGADQGMQKIGNQEKPVQFCSRRAWQYAVQTQCFSGGVPAVLPNLQTRLRMTGMSQEIRGWDEESAVGHLPAPLALAACESFPQTRLVFVVKEGSVPPREGAGCWRVLRWGGPSGGRSRWHLFLVMPTPCLSQGQFPTSSSAVPTTLSIFQNFPGKMALSFPFCG